MRRHKTTVSYTFYLLPIICMNKIITIAALSLLTACSTTVIEDEQRVDINTLEPNEQVQEDVLVDTELESDDDRSFIAFTGKKSDIISHEGKFNNFEASLELDETTPEDLTKATLRMTVDVASMETDSEGLTNHLQTDDFFGAEKFAKATFVSTTITAVEGNQYQITGDLTIRDVTKPITVDATLTAAGVQFTYVLDRTEFNVGPAAEGLQAIDVEVPIEVQVVFE